jgi:hypothetical protein
MSLGSRIAIGIVSMLAAGGFLISAMNPATVAATPIIFFGLAAFCGVITMACLFPKSSPVTLRIIGIVIFGTYAFYIYSSLHTDNLSRAIKGFFFWGIPSGYLAIMGSYPSWGKGTAGFNANKKKNIRR